MLAGVWALPLPDEPKLGEWQWNTAGDYEEQAWAIYDEPKNQRKIEFAYLNRNEMCNIVVTLPNGDKRKYTIQFDYENENNHLQYQTDNVNLFREIRRVV